MAERNRADYFKERRKLIGQFNVSVSRDKLDALTKKLDELGITKTEWLSAKIDEEISKEK